MNKDKEKVDNSKNNKDAIFIKKEALRNMITHVLRFGHQSLEECFEVMGLCIGNYNTEGKKVILENAIPITHGAKVEVGFEKEDYDLFSKLGEKYSGEVMGYYHSHPSWGIYLSDSDMKNMKFFQNDKKPYGFSIVFDHTEMGKNLGFEVYRLDDFKKADNYHKVEYEIEIPNTLEYFRWVQKFVEDFSKKTPILIKEINELKEEIPGDLQEIPTSGEVKFEQEIKTPELTQRSISGFQQGSQKLGDILVEKINPVIENWINDITQSASIGGDYFSKSIIKMKEAIISGLIKVNNWFRKTLNETVNEFKDAAFKYVDKRVENQKELSLKTMKVRDNIIKNINSAFNENASYINNELTSLVESITEQVSENEKVNLTAKELVETYNMLISNIQTEINNMTQNFEKNIDSIYLLFEKNTNEKIEKMGLELQSIKDFYAEIHNLLEKLQTTITGFRNIS